MCRIDSLDSIVWSHDAARAIDQQSIAQSPQKAALLMEQAGAAVWNVIKLSFGSLQPLVVLVGYGNNGGDAMVVARHARLAGRQVTVILVRPHATSKEFTDHKVLLEMLLELNVDVKDYEQGCLIRLVPTDGNRSIIIDGLTGLGFLGTMKDGPMKSCIQEVRELGSKTIVAIDLPSGLSADSWQLPEVFLPASLCVAIGGLKPCHVLEPSRSQCGTIICEPIGYEPATIEHVLATTKNVRRHDPWRDLYVHPMGSLANAAHKFTRGHVLIIGGSEGKLGAPLLSAKAAYHAGAGWVSLAVPAPPSLGSLHQLEVTYENFYESGVLDWLAIADFVTKRKVSALIVGPGIVSTPLSAAGMQQLASIQAKSNLFLVIDAGALDGVLDLAEGVKFDPARTILTPHPGEWHKLSHKQPLEPIVDLKSWDKGVSRLLLSGLSVIHKTSTPLVSPAFDKRTVQRGHVIDDPDYSVAKAGMGDVLSGVIAAIGPFSENASVAALEAHSRVLRAAKRLQPRYGKHGILPSLIAQELSSF